MRNSKDVICIVLGENGDIATVVTIPHETTATITVGAIEPLPGVGKGVFTGIGGDVSRLVFESGKIKVTGLSDGLSLDPSGYIADLWHMTTKYGQPRISGFSAMISPPML